MTITVLARQGPQVHDTAVRSAPMVRRCEVSVVRSTPAGRSMVSADRRRPGQLRRMNCALLKLWDLQPCIDAAALVLTELVTNAFQHGGGEDITVTWSADGTHLTIQVEDSSSVRPVLRTADESSESGRGLSIVEALADKWGVSEDGHTAHCALVLPKRGA
ncbi:ATP-binding protein [Streptomyces sp. SID8374]|uniref:ATP-binding protein n=1 Tax=Streptomyces sp. SID8374 TaxID=2690354 RepID=UPI0013689836|nr:ATP-binding protein [Streptomyces sp. SID8374]MYX15528.1 ATP-binding protein [Streptomyces sp. SID8374]